MRILFVWSAPVLAAGLTVTAVTPATAADRPLAASTRQWAPAAQASIHPGIATETNGAPCTANFVFTDAAGAVYLGQAAHCALTEAQTSVNGCTSQVQPLGTKVGLGRSGVTGEIAYSSWVSMQERDEQDESTCANNDFALIRIPADAVGTVNPSMPVFGGPTGITTDPPAFGEAVMSYGNSNLRGGIAALSPQRGFAVGSGADGWYHLVYIVPTGVPGDSGSGFLDEEGKALGDLIDVNETASNGVGDMGRALAYARAHSGIEGLTLELGTEEFVGP